MILFILHDSIPKTYSKARKQVLAKEEVYNDLGIGKRAVPEANQHPNSTV
jgi:hypothetical protein